MDASRELDALIAEKIFGIETKPWPCIVDVEKGITRDEPTYWRRTELKIVPHYSADMNAAWEVVEKIKSKGYGNFTIENCYHGWRVGWPWRDHGSSSIDHETISESAPHAICLAALKAVEGK